MPLASETSVASSLRCGRQSERLSRRDCAGTAHTTRSAPVSACAMSLDAVRFEGRVIPAK
ncbi:Uncharacterised protein [Mycobacteroides abscessus subsp. abscessus]|nr:Uncharacterised protein [Mycobacteroides abscessus subsp. abscessus]